jgi:asparagine synthase (glutamine-hydrolysing)
LRCRKKNRKSLPDFLPAHLSGSNRAILASVFTSVDAIRSVVPDFSLAEALRYRRLLWDQLQGDFFLRQRKYEIKTYLPDLLMRQDKMSMAHSIENRVPFLDNALVSLVLQFSEETLLRNADRKLEAKNLLKQIASQKFSPAFAYRPKKGFGIPLRAFMGSDVFRQRWEEEWLPGLKEMERFETGCLTHWLQNLGKASSDQVDMIWLAVSFQLWRDKYGIT